RLVALFPYPTLFRSRRLHDQAGAQLDEPHARSRNGAARTHRHAMAAHRNTGSRNRRHPGRAGANPGGGYRRYHPHARPPRGQGAASAGPVYRRPARGSRRADRGGPGNGPGHPCQYCPGAQPSSAWLCQQRSCPAAPPAGPHAGQRLGRRGGRSRPLNCHPLLHTANQLLYFFAIYLPRQIQFNQSFQQNVSMKSACSMALLLALAGCAWMSPSPGPAALWDAGRLELHDTDVVWPGTQWWRRYRDPQLDELVLQALAGNPSMTAAQARLAKANAAVRGTRAPLFPQADANYPLERRRLPENSIYQAPLAGSVSSDSRLALDFSYELDFWGKNRSRLNAAVSRQAAADADTQAARNVLARAVVRSYVNLQNAFAQHDVLQPIVVQRADVLTLTRDRQSAGLDTQVEVKQAESALAAAQVEVTQTEATIAQLRNQVAVLAGAGPTRGHQLRPAAMHGPAGVLPDSVPLGLLGHGPDIVAARSRAEAARPDTQAAHGEAHPSI